MKRQALPSADGEAVGGDTGGGAVPARKPALNAAQSQIAQAEQACAGAVTISALARLLARFKLAHLREGLAAAQPADALLNLVAQLLQSSPATGEEDRGALDAVVLGALKARVTADRSRVDNARLLREAAAALNARELRMCQRLLELAPREHQQARELSSALARVLLADAAPQQRAHGLVVVERLVTDASWAEAFDLAMAADADALVVAAAKRMLAARADRDAAIALVRNLLKHAAPLADASKVARIHGVHAEFPGLAEQGRADFFASLADMPAKAMGFCTLNPELRLDVAAAAVRAGEHWLARQLCTEPGDVAALPATRGVAIDGETAAAQRRAVQASAMQVGEDTTVLWCDTLGALRAGLAALAAAEGPLALDCEWKPVPDEGATSSPAEIIQMARASRVVIVDLRRGSVVAPRENRSEADALLGGLFASARKVHGFGIETDCAVLSRSLPDMKCWAALRACKANVPCAQGESLKTVAKRALALTVDKTQQMSDWSRRPLLAEQLAYAAVDALAIVRILCALRPPAAQPAAPSMAVPMAAAAAVAAAAAARFFCDERLRRLAKMLRAIGLDTLWEGPSGAGEGGRRLALQARVARAQLEARVFVSDDPLTANVPGAFYVGEVEELADRFKLVVRRFGLRTDVELLTRCTMCNGPGFVPISKAEAKATQPGVVTDRILAKVHEFWTCPSCGIVVWQGPKFDRLHAQIKSVIKAMHEP